MKVNVHYQTLSKINYLELSLGETELKYPKLVTKNYSSSFELSKYHKLTKSDPQNHQKFTSYDSKPAVNRQPGFRRNDS